MKILVVGGDTHYASWIKREIEFLPSELSFVKQADLVFFTGGADVSPKYYGSVSNNKTHSDLIRDELEYKFFHEARSYNIPMFGTCRGAQLLTALQPNGSLIQHVNGHAVFSPHEIEFYDGRKMLATSTHHQMMYPWNVNNFEIIAWSSNKLSDIYEFSSEKDSLKELPGHQEPEIVYYERTKSLCCQPHPEYMDKDCLLVNELNELLKQKFNL